MAYITTQNLIDRVGSTKAAQLTTDSGSTPDSALLAEVTAEAEGEVNGYLARRYAVPVDLTAHPELAATLRGKTLDIAVYRLHVRRPPVPDAHKDIYDSAIKWLTAVSKGEIVLPAATTPPSGTADSPVAEWFSSENDVTRENML